MKTNYFFLLFFSSILSFNLSAQESQKLTQDTTVFCVVEQSPEFPGGMNSLYTYLIKNMTYPEKALKKGIEGRVYVTFVVEKNGSISNVKILRGIGYGCDKEAKRVVKGMPRWKPGRQSGKNVRVQFNLPILFKLEDTKKGDQQKEETSKEKKFPFRF